MSLVDSANWNQRRSNLRSFLLVSPMEEHYGKIKAIIVSSILFGLIHSFTDDFDLFTLLEYFFGGIMLCLALHNVILGSQLVFTLHGTISCSIFMFLKILRLLNHL